MSKILAVFGATGVQGGSVISNILADPSLTKEYSIRAITRDVTSEKAKSLASKGVSVVSGDISDPSSLKAALKDAHTVFAVTTPAFGPDAVATELAGAKTIANVAVEQGVSYIIFSTLTAVTELSGGKYSHVTPFDAKAEAEKCIRSLPIKSAFVSLGYFMENFQTQPFLLPQKAENDTWVLARPTASSIRLPYISGSRDIGKFVGAILADPTKYEGKRLNAAAGFYTLDEIVALLAKVTGKKVVYKEVSSKAFAEGLPFIPEVFVDLFLFHEDFGGYWGPGSEKDAEWAKGEVKGKLQTLEEFLDVNPPKLE